MFSRNEYCPFSPLKSLGKTVCFSKRWLSTKWHVSCDTIFWLNFYNSNSQLKSFMLRLWKLPWREKEGYHLKERCKLSRKVVSQLTCHFVERCQRPPIKIIVITERGCNSGKTSKHLSLLGRLFSFDYM